MQCWSQGGMSMKRKLGNLTYAAPILLLIGCAGAKIADQTQAAPLSNTRPTTIAVYPFTVDPSIVSLNSGIGAKIYRSVSDENVEAKQLKLAVEVAESMCQQVASDLRNKGYTATCWKRGTPIYGDNVMLLDGQFTTLSEGNRLRRMVIGLGAGATVLDTNVQVSQRRAEASRQVLAFTTHADSGKMPGAGITGPAGAAAGGAAAAASLGANVAAAGVKTHTSSFDYLTDKTSEEIVDSLNQYYSQQGWKS